MRLLVTEDDPALAAFLRKALTVEGYEVYVAAFGEACLERLRRDSFDLLLLDLSLPDIDGSEVLVRLKQREVEMPIVVLTGRTQVEERIRCLDLGADDFLVKPFSFGELTARCRAVLRGRQRQLDAELRLGELSMKQITRSVTLAGAPIDLTPKEFVLLQALMLRGGECCSREDLLEQVWNPTSQRGPNIVDVYINYLRRKLLAAAERSGAKAAPHIETIRGAGYRVAVPSPTLAVSKGAHRNLEELRT